MAYTRFTVELPEEEAEDFKRVLNSSEFEYNSLNRFRGNGEYAEFVRWLIEEQSTG